ncbi:flippase [Fibrobacter sp. UWEL]|uniref:flippase n=1 Tax=Fibrobacter sp. UWEL TaxID=1896209 RepID=UPI00091AE918|nr:flippase [Fibrobacter sp. UWEL]SHK64717.1 Membrane protein involved in the export of O-antigen and teichoic acid [Fibrobacter sp. UWEL]
MTQNSIKKNYIYNLVYHLLVVFVPIITTPYVSRALHADGIGAHSYTSSVVNYFALLVNLGIASYGQLQIAKHREEKKSLTTIFFELTAFRLLLTVAVVLVYLMVVVQNCEESYKQLYYAHILYIIGYSLDITWFLQGLEEFKKIVLRNIVVKIASVVLILTFVNNSSDLVIYAILLNGSVLLGNASIWCFVPKYLQKVPLKEMNILQHIKPCLVYFIPTISTMIYLTLDKTMIGWFSEGAAENGYYEQAHKIEQMVVTFLTSLSVVMMPRMAYLFKNNLIEEMKKKQHESTQFILLLSFPMCFGVMVVSDYFVPLFLGPGYDECVLLLKIFSVLLVVVGLNNAVGKQILMATGRQNLYNKSVIVGCFVNVILNLFLIPNYLAVGAAVASVIAESVILILFVKYANDFICFGWLVKKGYKYLIASVFMFAVVRTSYQFVNMEWCGCLLLCLLGVFSYLLAVFLLKDYFVLQHLSKFFKTKKVT